MSDKVIDAPRVRFSVPALAAKLGRYDVKVFIASARKIAPYCVVSKRDGSDEDAYQRIFLDSRIRKIEEFINDGNVILPAIVLASGEGERACYEVGGDAMRVRLRFRPKGDRLFVVDGQHRLRGACRTEAELIFILAENLPPTDQAHQFVVINQEAHRIPTSLMKDLLPSLDKYFDVEDPQKKVRDLAVRLTEDRDAVLFDKIERFRQNIPGKVSLANFDRKWRQHFTPSGVLGMDTLDEAYPVVSDYFAAMKTSFPREWDHEKGNPFLKTVVFGAFSMVFPTVYRLSTKGGKSPNLKGFAAVFERLEGVDIIGLSKYGTGQAAEKVLATELLQALRD